MSILTNSLVGEIRVLLRGARGNRRDLMFNIPRNITSCEIAMSGLLINRCWLKNWLVRRHDAYLI